MYQVQERFLPEVMNRLQEAGIRHRSPSIYPEDETEAPETDQDLVVDVVRYLDLEKPPVRGLYSKIMESSLRRGTHFKDINLRDCMINNIQLEQQY